MTQGQFLPWLAAGAAGVALAFAADALVNWNAVESLRPPPPVAEPPRREFPVPRGYRALPPHAPTAAPSAAKILQVFRAKPRPTGDTLATAAAQGDARGVTLLLKEGAPAGATDASGRPALLAACGASQAGTARLLLEAGADVNAPGKDGRTPLIAAAGAGDVALMELLLEFDAAVDLPDLDGHTPLAWAVKEGKTEAARWLLAHKGTAEPACCHGKGSLVSHALERHDGPLLEVAFQAAPRKEWSKETREALFTALRQREKPIIRALLGGHADPPTPDGFRQPLLGYAIAWNQPELLNLLLDCGANPDTPLESPVERAFARLVPQKVLRFYLENEAGMTPLMLAAGLGQMESVQALLRHGARRGATTRKSKWAALLFAAKARQPEIMQVLLGKSPRPEDQQVRIEIVLASQVARLWKGERLMLTARVSTGRTGYPTPPGRYVVTDKQRNRVSTIYKVSMPYFMRLSCSEFGMHAGVVPDHPASHGCIRLPYSAAVRFYREADVGTLVTIR